MAWAGCDIGNGTFHDGFYVVYSYGLSWPYVNTKIGEQGACEVQVEVNSSIKAQRLFSEESDTEQGFTGIIIDALTLSIFADFLVKSQQRPVTYIWLYRGNITSCKC